ncbi:MAG: hypothetical protein JW801_01770 [Bacteroidales bacterium]|nr:hypothetical protein [Bacteroidales bacterium]
MKTIRHGILTFLLILSDYTILDAQVAGISASKLGAFNAGTVTHRGMEFEPSAFVSWSAKSWSAGRIPTERYKNTDSLDMWMESGLRFTYGAVNKLEIGCYLPFDFSSLSVGSKLQVMETENFGIAALAGINIPKLGETISLNEHSIECAPLFAGGLALSARLSEKVSFDLNTQVQTALKPTLENHSMDLFVLLDAGYFFKKGYQAVAELWYSHSSYEHKDLNNDVLIFNLGVTIETAKNYILVVNTPVPLTGKNGDISYGIGFALTILLE